MSDVQREARVELEAKQDVEQELKDIRELSSRHQKLETLMNRVNEESLKRAHREQDKRKAVGVDGVTKEAYEANLDMNVAELVSRMKKFSYKPQAVRRVYIPKADGKRRPLGIPSYEDRLVQSVMAGILGEIYEGRFSDCSFGFRPGRSAHQAVRAIDKTLMTRRVNYVLEADIKGFFDNVKHDHMMRFLEHDIADKNFLRYIKRFLIAGVMEGGTWHASDEGTPQGGLISPVLANIYLHYVLDLWCEALKKRCRGEVYYVRYADDFLLMFQYEEDACKVLQALGARLGKFGLELAQDKTRIVPFGRFKGTKEDFDFLGFTFFNARGLAGKYRVGVRTSKRRLKSKKEGVKAWLKTRLVQPVHATLRSLQLTLAGHFNYFGVSGNIRKLKEFWRYAKHATFRMLNRRSQRRSIKYGRFDALWDEHVKKPKVTKDIWSPRQRGQPERKPLNPWEWQPKLT